MTGWLVNDRLTAIPGTRTLWHHLLLGIDGLCDKTTGSYSYLKAKIEADAGNAPPDYIIRNAAYFPVLDVPCPAISFVQDILEGFQREQLVEVCAASRVLVFNSEFTRSMYPELHEMPYAVIPVGTDTDIFHECEPDPNVPKHAVMWVGSGHAVKGFHSAIQLARESTRPWVFVMKDDTEVPIAAPVYRKIPQEHLARIASACEVGACTSRTETQHLAGIEMGMCGLPLVTTNTGVYYDRPSGAWGEATKTDFHGGIERSARLDRKAVARYWRDEGFGLGACIEAWRSLVEGVAGAR